MQSHFMSDLTPVENEPPYGITGFEVWVVPKRD
jgi:hypothetical protein